MYSTDYSPTQPLVTTPTYLPTHPRTDLPEQNQTIGTPGVKIPSKKYIPILTFQITKLKVVKYKQHKCHLPAATMAASPIQAAPQTEFSVM